MSKGVRNGFEEARRSWYFRKTINGQLFRESTGFADKKSAERRASEIEHDIRAGIHGWKSTIPSFADWWAVYHATYMPQKSARNRDARSSRTSCRIRREAARRDHEVRHRPLSEFAADTDDRQSRPQEASTRFGETVRRERGLLQSIFERAIDEGHDIRNPFRGIKRGRTRRGLGC